MTVKSDKFVPKCARGWRDCIPHAVSTRGAGAGRSGRPFAFSGIAHQSARNSAGHKGAINRVLQSRQASLRGAQARSPDAVTGSLNIPQRGWAKRRMLRWPSGVPDHTAGRKSTPRRRSRSSPIIHRGVGKQKSAALITQRPQVQILPPLPSGPSSTRQSARFGSEWLLVQFQRSRPSTGACAWPST